MVRFLEQRIREPDHFHQGRTIEAEETDPSPGQYLWHIEVVDEGLGEYDAGPSLKLDTMGYPHISYIDGESFSLKYARFDGSNWQIETVEDVRLVCGTTSLALDTLNRPHISYTRSNNGEIVHLGYAYYDGTGWYTETVDSTDYSGSYSCLALDSAGRPHISYYRYTETGGTIQYARYDGLDWHIETIANILFSRHSTLLIDTADRPHLSYSNGTAKYAYHDGTTWQVFTLEPDSGGSSLALDDANLPHLIYIKDFHKGFRYAYYDGIVWHLETVADVPDPREVPSLVLDANNRPHVSYYTVGGLDYVFWDGGAWRARRVDVGRDDSIAVNFAGQAYIAYVDDGVLKLARGVSDPADWVGLTFASYRDGNWEIYASSSYGTDPIRLTFGSATDTTPELNRGATQIVFRSDRNGNNEIYRIDADGTNPIRLTWTDANEYLPTWSPDGAQIAFYSYRDGNAEIYTMNADGSNQTRLTYDPAWDGHPTWSPDGSQIAFVSERSGQYELWVMDADGSNQRQLTSGISYAAYPDWSPDGSRIALNDDANGDGWLDLAIIGADGTGLVHPLGFSPSSNDYLAPAWAPHSQGLAFAQVQWILRHGIWYWTGAYLLGLDPTNGLTYILNDSGYDWWPDWQSTDVAAPSSQVTGLPAWSGATFTVQWSGADNGPAGLKSYDVQVRDGPGGPWTDWLLDTAQIAATFTGQDGHTYYFRCRARDFAYNLEPYPEGDGDAFTTVDTSPPTSSASSPEYASTLSFPVTWSGSDAGIGLESFDVQVRDGQAGSWTDWLVGTPATSASFHGELGHTYYFRCRARDRLGNLEPYPAGDGDTLTHTPQYALSGRVLGNRDQPVALATVQTSPPALNIAISQPFGNFDLYFNQSGIYDLAASQPAFGPLPPMKGVSVPQTVLPVTLYLPPADDQVADGGFEAGDLALWSPSGEIVPLLTTTAHTGDWAALLGGPVPPPVVTPTMPFSAGAVLTETGGQLAGPWVIALVPPGAVSHTSVFTLTGVPTVTALPAGSQDVGYHFALAAVLTDGHPITATLQPMTLTVTYDDAAWQAAQVAGEETLALWRYDPLATNWLPVGRTVNPVSNTLVVTSEHPGLFALLGTPYAGPWRSTLEQTVALPSIAEESTLSLLSQVEEADPISDSLYITLWKPGEAVTYTLPLTAEGWLHAWWDLSAWNGPTVTLRVTWQQGGRDRRAAVLLDEISLGTAVAGAYPIYLPLAARSSP